MARSAGLVLVAILLLSSAVAAAQHKAGTDFVVTNVRVFDGRTTIIPNTHVAVAGGTIRAVGGDLAPWRSLPVVDGTGATLVPGFIDAHSHVRHVDDLRRRRRPNGG